MMDQSFTNTDNKCIDKECLPPSNLSSLNEIDGIVEEHILRDVSRTYVNEPLFKPNHSHNKSGEEGGGVRRDSEDLTQFKSTGCELLYELLCQFAIKHPEIGYCQGMNFIGAMVLIVSKAEIYGIQQAFNIFEAAVCEVQSFYIDDLPGFSYGLELLNDLLLKHFPTLHAHLEKYEVYMQLFASPWLHCLFTHPSVPLKFAMHIFDLFLLMGFEGILRVSLALLALHEKELMLLDTRIEMIKLLQLATTNVLFSQLNNVLHLALTFKFELSLVNRLKRIGSYRRETQSNYSKQEASI